MDIQLNGNRLCMTGEIVACDATKLIFLLETVSSPVLLFLSSEGGDVYESLKISRILISYQRLLIGCLIPSEISSAGFRIFCHLLFYTDIPITISYDCEICIHAIDKQITITDDARFSRAGQLAWLDQINRLEEEEDILLKALFNESLNNLIGYYTRLTIHTLLLRLSPPKMAQVQLVNAFHEF